MSRKKTRAERASCDCRKVGRSGCCNGGNRLSHPKTKETTNYQRSRSLPNVGQRKRNFRRKYEEAASEAVKQGTLSRQAKEVGSELAKYSDARGKAVWPAQETIAVDLNTSDRSVCRQVGELKGKGWVAVKHRFRATADGVRGRSNVYVLTIPAEFASGGGKQPPAGPVQPGHGPDVLDDEAQNDRPVEPEPSTDVPDEEAQADPEVIEQWKAALAAKDEATVRRLAQQHLEFVPLAGTPLGIGTIGPLAVRLAERGPP